VACPGCGKFSPINKAFCASCGKPVPKPVCPRCKSNNTRFVGRVGNYIGLGLVLFVFGMSAIETGQSLGYEPGTSGALVILSMAIPLLIGSLAAFFMPLARRTKRVKCSACSAQLGVAGISEFQPRPVSTEGAS
jgi:hypothetical protein